MMRLASLLYSIIGASLAGTFIIVALVAGYATTMPIIIAAAAGFIVALPVAYFVAKALMNA